MYIMVNKGYMRIGGCAGAFERLAKHHASAAQRPQFIAQTDGPSLKRPNEYPWTKPISRTPDPKINI